MRGWTPWATACLPSATGRRRANRRKRCGRRMFDGGGATVLEGPRPVDGEGVGMDGGAAGRAGGGVGNGSVSGMRCDNPGAAQDDRVQMCVCCPPDTRGSIRGIIRERRAAAKKLGKHNIDSDDEDEGDGGASASSDDEGNRPRGEIPGGRERQMHVFVREVGQGMEGMGIGPSCRGQEMHGGHAISSPPPAVLTVQLL